MKKIRTEDIEPLELAPGVSARIVNSDSMTIMHARLEAGAVVPEHSHSNEQVVNVIEGEIELTVEGKPQRLKPGDILILPSNVPHSARAITDCRIIDIFNPIREDLIGAAFSGYAQKDKN